MDLGLIAAAGLATGTVILFAAIGEILAERAGVLNLGVEGMMLMGAVSGFSVTLSSGNPWLGLAAAMVVGGLLGLLHGVVTIHLLADQVVSGLALTFLGTGLARVLGDGLTNLTTARLPTFRIPLLADIPIVGPIAFANQSILVYAGFLLVPATWFWIERTRPGLHLRAVGESPAAADAQGVGVHRLRLRYVVAGGVLAGLAGATITIGVAPGWFGDQTVNGRGWIAVGLVIFARWSPIRAAVGAYLFAAITPWILALQGIDRILGIENPFLPGRSATFFLEMLPYLFVIAFVILGSRSALRRRIGAPAALGVPYVRGERGL
jgi:general nucleoside transport system permease protein